MQDKVISKTALAKVWSAFTWLLVVAVVLLAAVLVGVRLFGYKPFAVVSPSMAPKYGVGDLVYALPTDPDKIEEGDVVTFVANAEGTVVTHRVVEADRESRCFYTKGDANDNQDGSPVAYENVVGVVKFSLPKMGYVSTYLTSASGRYAAVAAILVLILLMVLPELFKSAGKDRKEEKAEDEGSLQDADEENEQWSEENKEQEEREE